MTRPFSRQYHSSGHNSNCKFRHRVPRPTKKIARKRKYVGGEIRPETEGETKSVRQSLGTMLVHTPCPNFVPSGGLGFVLSFGANSIPPEFSLTRILFHRPRESRGEIPNVNFAKIRIKF